MRDIVLKLGLVLCGLCLLVACGGGKNIPSEPPPAAWKYEEGAITLNLKALPELNLYEDTAHTLYLCVYQLSNPNTYKLLSQDEAGLTKLLSCQRLDSTVASFQSVILQPGEKKTLLLDRAEGAKYVAVVAGYYQLTPGKVAKLFEIPVVIEKKGFIKKKILTKPGTLKVELLLGPYGIKKVEKEEAKK